MECTLDNCPGWFLPAVAWEGAAVALAIAYLLLAIRENIWCWAAGIGSSAIYLVLLAQAALFLESALQVFYIAVSVYGWRCWGRPQSELPIRSWAPRQHAAAIAVVALLALPSGALLAGYTPAALPFPDAIIAWGSVVTTWMVARKIIENWLYWFFIDSLSVYVYLQRGMWPTAALFGLYLVLIVIGYRRWRCSMLAQGA